MKILFKSLSTVQIILLAFLSVILAGSLLLRLPICAADNKAVSYIDALFTATTSTCVTGLVTVPTVTTWSFWGQLVILSLIQIGGMGVITVMAGFMILIKKKLGIEDRILIGDSFNLNSFAGMVRFVKKVIFLTLIIEGIGALLYMTVFVPAFGRKGIWISIFTSVSAFCNAGIDIIAENSLCNYVRNPIVNFTTMFLIISGGIGFIVLLDLGRILKNKKRRHVRFLRLHSKIALCVTLFLIITGAIAFFIFEYNNPNTIKDYTLVEKIMVSLFQSVTTRTAGFASLPQENLTDASALVSMLLMFIGGSPAGTAGGIKTVTWFVLLASARSVAKNKRTVDVFNRQLSADVIKRAGAVFVTSLFIVICSTIMVSALSDYNFLDVLYETISATATVGLSRGFTGSLNNIGKMIIIFTMYLGRVGPISLLFACSINKNNENIIMNPVEEISVG